MEPTNEAPQENIIEPIVTHPIDTPVEPPTDTPTDEPLHDGDSFVGKTISTVKDPITNVIIGIVIGESAMFGLNPDSSIQESIVAQDDAISAKEEIVVRIESPKIDIQEYSIGEKNEQIDRVQEKMNRLIEAKNGIIMNATEGWETQVERVLVTIESCESTIASLNRDIEKIQPSINALPTR